MNETMANLQASLEDIEAQIAATETEIETKQAEVAETNAEISDLQLSLTQYQNIRDELENALAVLDPDEYESEDVTDLDPEEEDIEIDDEDL